MKLILEFNEFDFKSKMDTLRQFSRECLIELHDKGFVIQVTPLFGTDFVNIIINSPYYNNHFEGCNKWLYMKDNVINFIDALNDNYEILNECFFEHAALMVIKNYDKGRKTGEYSVEDVINDKVSISTLSQIFIRVKL